MSNEDKSKRSWFDMSKLRIRTKRDWAIFWVFAALIAYMLGDEWNYFINDRLRVMGSPWLTNLNEPQGYGRMIAAVILMAIVGEVVLFLCHKPVKAKLAVLAAGVLLPLALVGLYRLNCNLIASVLWKEEPNSVFLHGQEADVCLKMSAGGDIADVSMEEYKEALEYCRNLTLASEEEQKAGLEWYKNAESPFAGVDSISMYFPEKYGHSYSFSLRLHEGYVYLWRGYSGDGVEVTFFEDNGVTEWFEDF